MWRWLPIAMVLAAVPVAAQTLDKWRLIMPPERYASGPYLWPTVVHEISNDEIAIHCKNIVPVGEGNSAIAKMGCTTIGPPTCDIYIQRFPAAVELSWDVLEHEKAHCRGWPGDHPD